MDDGPIDEGSRGHVREGKREGLRIYASQLPHFQREAFDLTETLTHRGCFNNSEDFLGETDFMHLYLPRLHCEGAASVPRMIMGFLGASVSWSTTR